MTPPGAFLWQRRILVTRMQISAFRLFDIAQEDAPLALRLFRLKNSYWRQGFQLFLAGVSRPVREGECQVLFNHFGESDYRVII